MKTIERYLHSLARRLRTLFLRGEAERELAAELQDHLERQAEENRRRGMPPEEARRAARIELGGEEQVRERCRDSWGARALDELAQDVRYGLRQLRRRLGLTAVIVISLTLGIGANTAVFSLINAVMLQRLPVKDPNRLVLLNWHYLKGSRYIDNRVFSFESDNGGSNAHPFAWPVYEALRARNRVFSSLFAFVSLGRAEVSLAGKTSLVKGEMVTGNYFSGLGVRPLLGRALEAADERRGAAPAAVISYGFWTRLFARSPRALGQNITVDGVPFTIVGVAPREFFGVQPGRAIELWVPFLHDARLLPFGEAKTPGGRSMYHSRRWWWLVVMGRLQPGIGRQQAAAQMRVLYRQAITAGLNPPPKPSRIPRLLLEPGARGISVLRQQFSPELRLLMALVAVVLLLACANVAGLLLARAGSRQAEMAVRQAMGAPRRRLVRQWLTEGLLLSLAGGGLGLILAIWGSHALWWLLAGSRQPITFSFPLDATVLGYTLAISLSTGLLFSMLPALHATRVAPAPALKGNRAATAAQSGHMNLGKALVMAQVALSLALLISAGLFIRTLANLEDQPLGFNPRHLLLFNINPQAYKGPRLLGFYGRLLRRLQSLPGVQSATLSSNPLLAGVHGEWPIRLEGQKTKGGKILYANYNLVGPSFFQTMGIDRLLGRGAGWQDTPTSRSIAIVNQAFTEKFLGGGNPIGHTFRFDYYNFKAGQYSPSYRIVGLVRDAKYARLRKRPSPTIYLPYTQAFWLSSHGMHYELRSKQGDPLALLPAVRRAVRQLDPMLPMAEIKTQAEQIASTLTQERAYAWLWGLLAGLAALLAAIGIYGLMAYAVARRTHEIGIRMALGAARGGIAWMVVREVLALAAIGAAGGLAIALAAGRLVASLLFGVRPLDAPTLALATAMMLALAALAGWLPARRAARLDPVATLRCE